MTASPPPHTHTPVTSRCDRWACVLSGRRGAAVAGTADSFSINTAENEIGYQQFPPGGGAGQSLYWALPARLFLGNRVSTGDTGSPRGSGPLTVFTFNHAVQWSPAHCCEFAVAGAVCDGLLWLQLTSYGGRLSGLQRYEDQPGGRYYADADVIISGSGVTLSWVRQADPRPQAGR